MINMSNKVFVLGIDGGTFNLINPWAEKGELPNFKKVLDEGVHGKLRSSIPPVTIPAWPCIYTGKNPGKLGLFYFQRVNESYEKELYNLSDVASTKFWDYFENKEVGVVNSPLTFPPEEVNGFMLSPFGEEKEGGNYTYPERIQSRIPEEYEIIPNNPAKASNSETLKNKKEKTIGLEKTLKYLVENEEWDCIFSVFHTIDGIQHAMYEYMYPDLVGEEKHKKWGDAIKKVYKLLDDFLGDLTELEDTNILMVSDHGAGFWDLDKPQKFFHGNDWLRRQGWFETKSSFRDKVFDFFSKFGITKMKVHEFFRSLGFDLRRSELLNEKIIQKERKVTSKIDFSETEAFLSFGCSGFGGIRINLEGREKNGQVPKEKYNEFRKEVIEGLEDLTDSETGRKVVKKVWRREGIYGGEFLERAPDIVFQCSENYDVKRILEGRLFSEVKKLLGIHEMDGIFMAHGPNIKEGHKIEGAEIIDIAPTLLHMNGISVPEDMDGRVLRGIFKSNSELDKEVEYQEPLERKSKSKYEMSGEDEEKVRERLKGLGYLE